MADHVIVRYISNGDPACLPPVGSDIPVNQYWVLRVEGYGESQEVDYPDSPTGKAYVLELQCCYVLLKGSPIAELDRWLGRSTKEEK